MLLKKLNKLVFSRYLKQIVPLNCCNFNFTTSSDPYSVKSQFDSDENDEIFENKVHFNSFLEQKRILLGYRFHVFLTFLSTFLTKIILDA
jgi:hypothetical protein